MHPSELAACRGKAAKTATLCGVEGEPSRRPETNGVIQYWRLRNSCRRIDSPSYNNRPVRDRNAQVA
jgi:hypothetical protein